MGLNSTMLAGVTKIFNLQEEILKTAQKKQTNLLIEEIFRDVYGEMLHLNRIGMVRYDNKQKKYLLMAGIGREINLVGSEIKIDREIIKKIKSREPVWTPTPGIGADAYIPLTYNGSTKFIFIDDVVIERGFNASEKEFLISITNWLSEILKIKEIIRTLDAIKKKLEKSNRESRTDGLTGIDNQRAGIEKLNELFRIFKKGYPKSPVSLVIIDTDNFKQWNDVGGHPMGDNVLKTLSSILRKVGEVARYGGDEFLLFISKDKNNAKKILEKTALNFKNNKVLKGNQLPNPTFSAGICELTKDIKSAEEWFELADKKLYQAKDLGRNRIEI